MMKIAILMKLLMSHLFDSSLVLIVLLANESDIDAIFLADATKVYDRYLHTLPAVQLRLGGKHP